MFHQRTYETFSIQPANGEMERVKQAEARLGVSLPEALKEWYARPDAVTLASRQDCLHSLEKIGLIKFDGKSYLHFMTENQGVCIWATEIDSLPDPPVLVNVDNHGWKPYSSSFSDAIFCQIWDWQDYPISAYADADTLKAEELSVLQNLFQALPKTRGWPSSSQSIRLDGQDRSLLLWIGSGMCHFNLRARSSNAFKELLNLIWNMSDVRQRIEGSDSISKEMIRQMKLASPISR